MLREMEEVAKKQAAYEAEKALRGMKSESGVLDGPCEPGTLRRVESELNRARRESNRANRLEELQYLLHKNPDVARILDLMEEVR